MRKWSALPLRLHKLDFKINCINIIDLKMTQFIVKYKLLCLYVIFGTDKTIIGEVVNSWSLRDYWLVFMAKQHSE